MKDEGRMDVWDKVLREGGREGGQEGSRKKGRQTSSEGDQSGYWDRTSISMINTQNTQNM